MRLSTTDINAPHRELFRMPRAVASFPLRAKLILAFLIITILSVGGVSLVTNRVLQASMTQSLGERLHTLAQGRAKAIGDLLTQEIQRLNTLALNKPLQDAVTSANAQYQGNANQIQAQLLARDTQWRAARDDVDPLIQTRLFQGGAIGLQSYQAIFPNNIEIFVTDRYGGVVATTNRTSDYLQADEAWWQVADNQGQGAVSIGQPVYDDSSKASAVTIAVPVYRPGTREVIGVLRSTYRLQALANLLLTNRFGATGDSDLLFAKDQRLRSEGDLVAENPATAAQLRSIASRTYLAMQLDGEQVLIGAAPVMSSDAAASPAIGQLNWIVIVDQQSDEALHPLNDAIGATLMAGFGALLVSCLLGLVIAQAISVPLSRVRRTAQRIAAGDLGQRVQIAQRDEIGALAQSFNTMAATLAARVEAEQTARSEAERLQQAEAEQRLELERTVAKLHDSIAQRDQLSATIRELSNPVLPIQPGLLVMPLVGVIDQGRAQGIVHTLLRAIEQQRAQLVILDVTGVPMIDTHVASVLLSAAEASRLLGAQTILVGLRPELAQTIVGLGIDLSQLSTQAEDRKSVV